MCNQTTCVYWYSYGDGSLTTGDFVYDIITMDGINGQKQQVNCDLLISMSILSTNECITNINMPIMTT